MDISELTELTELRTSIFAGDPLELEGCDFDQDFSDKLSELISEASKTVPSLRISFQNSPETDLWMEWISDLGSVSSENRLEYLEVDFGFATEGVHWALGVLSRWLSAEDIQCQLPRKIDLILNNCEIGKNNFVTFVENAVKSEQVCDHLTIDFSYNNVYQEGSFSTCIADLLSDRSRLPTNESLTLNFSSCGLGNEGFIEIMESLVSMYHNSPENDRLKLDLILSDNRINHTGLIHLLSSIFPACINASIKVPENFSLDLSVDSMGDNNELDGSRLARVQLENLFSSIPNLPLGFTLNIRGCCSADTDEMIVDKIIDNKHFMNLIRQSNVNIMTSTVNNISLWVRRQQLIYFVLKPGITRDAFHHIASYLKPSDCSEPLTSKSLLRVREEAKFTSLFCSSMLQRQKCQESLRNYRTVKKQFPHPALAKELSIRSLAKEIASYLPSDTPVSMTFKKRRN